MLVWGALREKRWHDDRSEYLKIGLDGIFRNRHLWHHKLIDPDERVFACVIAPVDWV